jgi:disulfide bond formation protein DsbB
MSALARLPSRFVNFVIFDICLAMLAIGYYMQYQMRLEPCPLCIMQRIFFFATGLTALAAAIHNPGPTGRRNYGIASTVFALAGAGFAMRQIYLQHLPKDQIPACLPSIEYMLDADFPLKDVMNVLLKGDGNCAEITWLDPLFNFFTIPDLSLIGFAMLAATSVWVGVRKA